MRTIFFLFFSVFFRVNAFDISTLRKLQAASRSSTKNAHVVTPLLSSAEDVKKAREEALVKPLAGNVICYAGFFTVHPHYHANMYFWFCPCEKEPEKAPVILWIHGGPAISAMMGLFEENGPYEIVDGNATLRETSWTKHYNVLYLDSPIGTGFSYTLSIDGYSRNIYEETYYLYKALVQFYKMFPEYAKNAFYMVGQSLGGKRIPVLANLIHKMNNQNSQKINLKGMMIGAGSLDPINQLAFAHYLYEYGVVDRPDRDLTIGDEVKARCYLDSEYFYEAYERLRFIYSRMEKAGYPTPLDVNNPHINMSFYDAVADFVTREDIRPKIHVGDVRFYYYTSVVWWKHGFLSSVGRELSMTVQLGYPVLLYAGQYDMSTTPEQIDRVIASLHWSGLPRFQQARAQPWYSHGELAGYRKSFANLHQVFVRKANHMIVRSQPKWMLDLLKSFAL